MFAEEHTIDMRLPAPNLDLSLSLPGIYFVGIFGSFGTGVSTNHNITDNITEMHPLRRCPKELQRAGMVLCRNVPPLWPSTRLALRLRFSPLLSSFRL